MNRWRAAVLAAGTAWVAGGCSSAPKEEPAAAAPPSEPAPRVVAPAEPAAPAYREYTVRAGDTYYSIATREMGSARGVAALERANPGVDAARLRIGQVLRIPPLPAATAANTARPPAVAPMETPAATAAVPVASEGEMPPWWIEAPVREGGRVTVAARVDDPSLVEVRRKAVDAGMEALRRELGREPGETETKVKVVRLSSGGYRAFILISAAG